VHLSRYRSREARAIVWLSLSWTIVVLLFFSVSSRIEHYALPLFPPLALLVGIALTPESLFDLPEDARRQRWIGRGFSFLGILGAALAVISAGALLLWASGWQPIGDMREAAELHLLSYKFYFAPLFDLPPSTLARLVEPLLGTTVALSLGLVLAWWMNRRGWRVRAVGILAGMMMVFFLFAFQSLAVCEEVLSSKQFGRELSRLYRPGDQAIAVGDFETANSVNFYSPLPIAVYRGTAAVLQWGLSYPDAPATILTRGDLLARWKGPDRTFVLTPDALLQELPLEGYSVVLRSGGRTLLCNRPIPAEF
jgi:hypothetical protein